ncbi:MAG: hypothetical protein RIS76_2445 [Verrucomicrobiota bacterium]|jgi:hypothetical protein
MTLLLAVGTFAFPEAVRGDGGVVRLRSAGESFVVTLFTAPTLSSATPSELAVLVQQSDDGSVVLDATVELVLTPPKGAKIRADDVFCGPVMELPPTYRPKGVSNSDTLVAIPGGIGSPLMYGLRVRLPSPGNWNTRISVRRGPQFLSVDAVLPVGGPAQRLFAVWPSLLLPPVGILLFTLNRRLRRQSP